MMEKFEFLLGDWNMDYNIPRTVMSEAGKGTGTGTFKRALNDKYVFFNYEATVSIGNKKPESGSAQGIFVWDKTVNNYRFWWFESYGNFMQATCNFIDDETLYLNWHNSLLRQTFKKSGSKKVVLRMEQAVSGEHYELVLEVIFTRI